MLMVTPDMSVLHPMHPAAQVALLLGQDHQVEVVGHQAKAQHRQGNLDAGVGQGLEEGVVVPLLVEDLAAAVAPVEDVVTDAARRGSCCAWYKV
jgi:hypothetical protein